MLLDEPFRASAAIAAGLVTRPQLRGPRYLRLFPDVYVHVGDRPPDLLLRSLGAARLVAGRGVLGGWSAATLLGADAAPRDAPAEVVVTREQRTHPGLLVRRGAVPAAETWSAHGCPVTSPLRTAYDLARRLPLVEAVVAVDALGRVPAARFVPADLLARREIGARGCRRLDRVAELADPRAESPMGTRTRLMLVLAGLPAPEVQYVLREANGRLVARFDLAYPSARLAIEYDGAGHDVFGQRGLGYDDRRRDLRTGALGWRTIRLTATDLGPRRAEVIAAIRAHLRSPRPT
ncbi:hypothetical protein PSU4_21280 [Pseudonocardia sulfidoxydans NBRC 16205]|uniref:DUF559 domain-containing protein n=1 Tax=Pseudonocardia sulfidoxydans NBRC 16205 TaxID=1223511 RepID=A0A511DHD4_9PSEU|nr:hypothetical protein [Pseudonocardia sulfidoxydans]GEL23174.1 hypothetical protein PSU4_21280 [Pseudonocardia sulfidoxydans NBRC 16205]